MQADDATEQGVRGVLSTFNDHLANRDLEGVLGLFGSNPEVTVIGSEAGETAVGPAELRRLFQRIFARAGTFQFEWRNCRALSQRDLAWFFADAIAHYSEPEHVATVPYRVTGVLEWRDDRWRLAQYHGSEPVRVQDLTPTPAWQAARRPHSGRSQGRLPGPVTAGAARAPMTATTGAASEW